MCGITGVFGTKEIDKNTLSGMTDVIAHRGPDGFGYYYGTDFAFGHRRLAIVDLSVSGKQPMQYIDRYIITYNGEIYNYLELKETLSKAGYTFKTETDTEIIMASYDYWGSDCLNKLNGMWAFVIYDKVTDKVFISRDRFGIKPLYYFQKDELFVFASEIKSLFKHPDVPKNYNLAYCNDYLSSTAKEYKKETAFTSIYRFDNGSYIECDMNNLFKPLKETKFWDLVPNESNEKYCSKKASEYADEYLRLLNDSVRLRLRADVKVGSALSGGLDSSSVVYLINEELRKKNIEEQQETFSSVYKTKGTEDCDESFYINKIAKNLSVNSNQIEPSVEDILTEHEKFVYHLDTPAADTLMSSWYTYMLTQQKGVTVTLDGQGADEQLGGYLTYLRYHIGSSKWTTLFRDYKSFYKIPGSGEHLKKGLVAKLLRTFLGKKLSVKLFRALGKTFEYKSLNRKLYEDLELSLETLFHYADRGSMAFSVESRMPFMDFRLVEFLASVPSSYKLHDGWTKYLARKAFENKISKDVVWRKDKMGWQTPESYWFNEVYKEKFVHCIRHSSLIKTINPELSNLSVENMSKYEFGYLVRCYVLATWHRVFWRK